MIDVYKLTSSTDYVKETAKKLNYEMYDMLEQCLDEVDTLAVNLEEEDG